VQPLSIQATATAAAAVATRFKLYARELAFQQLLQMVLLLLLLLPQPLPTCRLSSDRLTAASTLAGVGRELKMLGTYFVNTCTGWWPASRHDWLNLPRMPAGGRRGGGSRQSVVH
jgi:hypothetical protein